MTGSFILDGLIIVGGIAVVFYGWEIFIGNAKYKRWAREGRNSTDDV